MLCCAALRRAVADLVYEIWGQALPLGKDVGVKRPGDGSLAVVSWGKAR